MFQRMFGKIRHKVTKTAAVTKPKHLQRYFYASAGIAIGTSCYNWSFTQNVIAANPSPAPSSYSAAWNYDWDGRHCYYLDKSQPKVYRKYTLVRHGQYGGPLKKLTELGREQAKMTGKKLKSENIEYDLILCSKMIRAQETLDIILNELYNNDNKKIEKLKNDGNIVRYDEDLNEGAPCYVEPVWESLFENGFFDNINDESTRITRAFDKHIHRCDINEYNKKNKKNNKKNNKKDKNKSNDKSDQRKVENVLIVGHGNVFRYFICRALQFPKEAWLRLAISNCSISTFRVKYDGTVSLYTVGSNSHFTKDTLTYN